MQKKVILELSREDAESLRYNLKSSAEEAAYVESLYATMPQSDNYSKVVESARDITRILKNVYIMLENALGDRNEQ
jgi:hypothetical protein